MKTLNRFERAMVIEYYATQCAEEMPANDDWAVRAYHVDLYWMKTIQALGQGFRAGLDAGWNELVENIVSSLNFDRDPAGHLYEAGDMDTEHNRHFYHDHYNDIIGAGIDAISQRAH